MRPLLSFDAQVGPQRKACPIPLIHNLPNKTK